MRACVGQTISAAALASGAQFGGFVSGVARDRGVKPGVGDDVQALQAGQVEDAAFQNTCN